MSTISQGKVTTLMQTLNKIEQRIKKLHSLIRFVLEKILERHFYMPSTRQYSRNVLLSFIKKQLKLANLVLKHRIGYLTIVNRGNGYETRQSSLLYVFVLFFGLDPAQNTIVVYSVLRN